MAAPVDGFVGFAIGRSIWEQPSAAHNRGHATENETIGLIARRYLRFARRYCTASEQVRPDSTSGLSPARGPAG